MAVSWHKPQSFTLNTHRMGTYRIHKITVMRDQDHFTVKLTDKAFEPSQRREIKIVGRLIQKKHIGFGRQEFYQIDPDLITARKTQWIFLQILLRKPKSKKEFFDLVEVPLLIFGENQCALFPNTLFGKDKMLFQCSDTIILGDTDLTIIPALLTQYHLKKCRFARTVTTDKTDLLIFGYFKIDITKEGLPPKAFGKVGQLYHRLSIL